MMNLEIRIEMTKHNLKQWQVAKMLNISESVLSRKLRNELTQEEKERIIQIMRKEGEK